MAVGNADGERAFYFNPVNPSESSMYGRRADRVDENRREQVRTVPIRRRDRLLAEGAISIALMAFTRRGRYAPSGNTGGGRGAGCS
jgi:hypothetical protein